MHLAGSRALSVLPMTPGGRTTRTLAAHASGCDVAGGRALFWSPRSALPMPWLFHASRMRGHIMWSQTVNAAKPARSASGPVSPGSMKSQSRARQATPRFHLQKGGMGSTKERSGRTLKTVSNATPRLRSWSRIFSPHQAASWICAMPARGGSARRGRRGAGLAALQVLDVAPGLVARRREDLDRLDLARGRVVALLAHDDLRDGDVRPRPAQIPRRRRERADVVRRHAARVARVLPGRAALCNWTFLEESHRGNAPSSRGPGPSTAGRTTRRRQRPPRGSA
mmetsp:Transcript_32368/g.110012  ORF Transcript_32368/g.110012 Transcript_32368/m.110012 type:complete len:282 (+) Transcript_32368:6-851(+)